MCAKQEPTVHRKQLPSQKLLSRTLEGNISRTRGLLKCNLVKVTEPEKYSVFAS